MHVQIRGSPGWATARGDPTLHRSGRDVVWTSPERSESAVPKLSVGAGRVYVHTKEPAPSGIDAWYVTAIDFHTGQDRMEAADRHRLELRRFVGANDRGAGGDPLCGVFNGLLAVRDSAPAGGPRP